MEDARILICEDEVAIAHELGQSLIETGYQVLGPAPEAETALALVERERPDLAIMDIKLLGDIDGTQLALMLHERFNIPSIYLSGHYDSELVDKAKLAEPLGYLLKPYRLDELLATIEVGLSVYRRREDPTQFFAVKQSDQTLSLSSPSFFVRDSLRQELVRHSGSVAWRIASFLERCLAEHKPIFGLLEKLQYFSKSLVAKNETFSAEDLVKGLRLQTEKANLRIEIIANLPEEPIQISADRKFLDDAVLEMLAEAASANPNGEIVTLSIRREYEDLPELFNMQASPGSYLVLSVSDPRRISSPELGLLAEPCYHRDSFLNFERVGYFLAYIFAYRHNGWVTVRTEERKGTIVSLYLPDVAGNLALNALERDRSLPTEIKNSTVLIIDDEPAIVAVLQKCLSDSGFNCYGFNNPCDAIEWYRHHVFEVDIVLLDLSMPQMTGRECFQQMRALNPAQTVALMSGNFDPKLLVGVDRKDIARFFDKPFELREVVGWAEGISQRSATD